MKILTILGARPQFIKASVVSAALEKVGISEEIIHTGQHYDSNMSDIFFEELRIKKPKYNLGIGSGSHASQTGLMMIEIEKVLVQEKPDAILVYGDTNSTLAGAIAASKLLIPVIHVEAGLRSFNMAMPEEQNRILTDHISSMLLCPTENAISQLCKENIFKEVHFTGDVMYDSSMHFLEIAKQTKNSEILLREMGVKKSAFYLSTLHRAENTDDISKLEEIFSAFESVEYPVVIPVHPRIKQMVEVLSHKHEYKNIIIIEPLGYLDMLLCIDNAIKVITDSGGLQKESYFLKTPCVTLRNETEWIETLINGMNELVAIDQTAIAQAITRDVVFEDSKSKPFGNGDASLVIANIIKAYFQELKCVDL